MDTLGNFAGLQGKLSGIKEDTRNVQLLTSMCTPRLRVLQRHRIAAEVPCLGHPKSQDCRYSQTGLEIRERGNTSGSVFYLCRIGCRTSATLAGVCSPGPDLSKSERSFTDPVNGTRMMLLIGCEHHWQQRRVLYEPTTYS